MRGLVRLAAAVSLAAVTAPAGAESLLFSLSGPDTASFVLDSQPTVRTSSSNDNFQVFAPVTVNGTLYTNASVQFFKANEGVVIFDINYLSSSLGFADINSKTSFDLFTGSVSSPTFKTGTFNFINYSTMASGYTLTIGDAPATPAAVPEPASWALMIGGFGMVGTALRLMRRWAASFA